MLLEEINDVMNIELCFWPKLLPHREHTLVLLSNA